MHKKIKLVEFFSGIGSQAKALKNLGYDIDLLATSEWDMQAFIAYDAIHNSCDIYPEIELMSKSELIEELSKYTLSLDGKIPMSSFSLRGFNSVILKRALTALRRTNNLVDIQKIEGSQLPNRIDLLTYSFPCQDLSNLGAFHGNMLGIDKDAKNKSTLLWQVGRILNEAKEAKIKLPKYLVMENVPQLLSPRHFPNFKVWINELEDLGYVSGYYKLNAMDFGIPQHRPRLLMLSIFCGKNKVEKDIAKEFFAKKSSDDIVRDYCKSKYYHSYAIKDLLRLDYQNPKYWNEAVLSCFNDTPSRRRIWQENPVIVNEFGEIYADNYIRTLTTKQDRNPNSGNIFFDSGIEGKSKYRNLTPRECMIIMGFDETDYEKLVSNNPISRARTTMIPRDKILRLAGNSIPVKLLEGFFYQLRKFESFRRLKKKLNKNL